MHLPTQPSGQTGGQPAAAIVAGPIVASPVEPGPALVLLVDFKWLMASEGHRIDLDRLQGDRAYIRGCLALAAGSRSVTLRQAAERLAGQARAVGWLLT